MSIDDIAWEPPFLEPHVDEALEAALRRDHGGTLPPGTRQVSHAPWLARAPVLFDWFGGRLMHIEPRLAETLALVVSQDNSCRYCFAAHRVLMRFSGVSERAIRRLEHDLLTNELPEPEQRAIAFARRLSRSTPPVTGTDLERLRDAGWTDGAVREMALAVAAMIALNRYSTFLALDPVPYEALPDRWYAKLLRPAFGAYLRLHTRRGRAAPFDERERGAPFARVINGFDGLPLGRSLRTIIDEAWAFDGVSREAKALMVAVVAHVLGEEAVRADARVLAFGEGTSPATFDAVLAHLDAAGLDPHTRIAVAFARDSVFYEPAPIQRRTRALAAELPTPVLIDLVGFASFANVIARLGAFAHTP